MKLHNRMVNAKLWDDMDLAEQFPALGMMFYGIVLPQAAEDSGCLEDDMRLIKKYFFANDPSVTVTLLSQWRDALVASGKLFAYQADGKRYLWMANFLTYQKVPRPSAPTLPLPPWLTYTPPTNRGSGVYMVTGTLAAPESLDVSPSSPEVTPSDFESGGDDELGKKKEEGKETTTTSRADDVVFAQAIDYVLPLFGRLQLKGKEGPQIQTALAQVDHDFARFKTIVDELAQRNPGKIHGFGYFVDRFADESADRAARAAPRAAPHGKRSVGSKTVDFEDLVK